jgi:hypothetical protein
MGDVMSQKQVAQTEENNPSHSIEIFLGSIA